MPLTIFDAEFTPGAEGVVVLHADVAPAANLMPVANPAKFQTMVACEQFDDSESGGAFDTPHTNAPRNALGLPLMSNQNGMAKYDITITIKANPKHDFPLLLIPSRTPIWLAHSRGILFQHKIFKMLVNDVKRAMKSADSNDYTITGRIHEIAYDTGNCLGRFQGATVTDWTPPGTWAGVTPTTTGGLKTVTGAGAQFYVGTV